MRTMVIKSRKKNRKAVKFFASLVFMALSAFLISMYANMGDGKTIGMCAKEAVDNLWKTVNMQTVENGSPLLEYGLYAQAGMDSFPNWEMAFISGGISSNSDVNKMVAAMNAAEENSEALEASVADEDLIIDRAEQENGEGGSVEVIEGEVYMEPDDEGTETESVETSAKDSDALKSNLSIIKKLKKTLNLSYLIKNFYIVDSSTNVNKSVFNVDKLLKKDCTLEKDAETPQILIYHTHGGSEAFADSKDGDQDESVVGVGSVLAEILSEDYGFNVIHDETCYDVMNGGIDRSKAYNQALTGVKKTLKKYPDIQVLIDLHRDSAGSNHQKRVTTINGKETAQVMFFNGLSRNSNGDISYLKNSNLQGNLAFSLQMKMKAMELYPNFTTKIYLKQYRYNLHLRDKSLLIELGNNLNTVAEAKNAMEPLAEVLNEVLNGD